MRMAGNLGPTKGARPRRYPFDLTSPSSHEQLGKWRVDRPPEPEAGFQNTSDSKWQTAGQNMCAQDQTGRSDSLDIRKTRHHRAPSCEGPLRPKAAETQIRIAQCQKPKPSCISFSESCPLHFPKTVRRCSQIIFSSSSRRPDVGLSRVHHTTALDALTRWGWGSSGASVSRTRFVRRSRAMSDPAAMMLVPWLPSSRTFLLPPVSWTFTKRRVYLSLFMARPLLFYCQRLSRPPP